MRAHWAGCPETPPEGVRADPLGLQQGRTDALGYVVRELADGWILVADSEDATADAALAEHLADTLCVPVLWVVSVESADAARVTWFGSDEHREPDEQAGPAALEVWLDQRVSGWRTGWADPGGARAAFRPVDADLYVEDSAWLTATAAQAGAIQVRAGDGVDTEAVAREVRAYWLECGARSGD
ncbi:MAG: hypothetical protein H0V89_05335, partial [Deltaproteobacteria bacterium]|nr:hypothetical protein [Deltaproteobacteria bacterium]